MQVHGLFAPGLARETKSAMEKRRIPVLSKDPAQRFANRRNVKSVHVRSNRDQNPVLIFFMSLVPAMLHCYAPTLAYTYTH